MTILAIAGDRSIFEDIPNYLKERELGDFLLTRVDSIEEAETYLFEHQIVTIIAETDIEGVSEIVTDMKADEMFRHLPVVGIVERYSRDEIAGYLDSGFDSVIEEDDLEELLLPVIKPLIEKNLLNSEMTEKISQLQEQAIRDYLLLDIVKNYIARTTWDLAEDFAQQQKIVIPEEQLELTVVFGDLKEFTSKTQKMEPEAVIRYLNTGFEVVSTVIYEFGGDIDKFIGDAFLAVFPDPRSAVDGMIELQEQLAELNKQRITADQFPLLFRIGIHTGPVIRGNVGGFNRYDNTLIGDTVNTAARLESLATPGGITISEMTGKRMGAEISEKYMRTVHLKGREGTIKIYDIYEPEI